MTRAEAKDTESSSDASSSASTSGLTTASSRRSSPRSAAYHPRSARISPLTTASPEPRHRLSPSTATLPSTLRLPGRHQALERKISLVRGVLPAAVLQRWSDVQVPRRPLPFARMSHPGTLIIPCRHPFAPLALQVFFNGAKVDSPPVDQNIGLTFQIYH